MFSNGIIQFNNDSIPSVNIEKHQLINDYMNLN